MKNIAPLFKLAMMNGTPLLAYNRSQLQNNFQVLKEIKEKHQVNFLLAVKSFPHPEVLHLAQEMGMGFDVSNVAEVNIIPRKDSQIWLTDPKGLGQNFEEKKELIKNISNLNIIIDRKEDLEIVLNSEIDINIGIRLNTDFLGTHSRFGMDLDEARFVMKKIKTSHSLKFQGIHFHYSSEKNSMQDYIQLLKRAIELTQESKLSLNYINLGGGLHSIGFLNLKSFIGEITSLVKITFPQTILLFEPGRLLSENAGFAVGKILKRKILTTNENKFIEYTIDLSAVCHLQWTNPELIITANNSCVENDLSNVDEINFYGPTCYEKDLIGKFKCANVSPPSYQVGEFVFFKNVSGYAFAFNHSFNGISPAEVVLFS